MFTQNKDAIYRAENLFVWFLLAFQGGLLNIGGFLASHRFVSHITGFATLAGERFSKLDFANALGLLVVPLFFIMGVMTSAFFVERRRIQHKKPLYTVVFGIMVVLLLSVSLMGSFEYYGFFGESFDGSFKNRRDYVLLFILVLTCGLQNAVISSASGYAIRTTHLTGPVTDLGIGLVRLGTLKFQMNKDELFVLICLLGIITSFIVGSLVGAMVFSMFKFQGFFLPTIISTYTFYRLHSQSKLITE